MTTDSMSNQDKRKRLEARIAKLGAAFAAFGRVSAGTPKPAASTAEAEPVRELPRDLVTILRTEAKNQRTPPIDYVIAEDGGRMVHRPDPDIAMAELLEEAARALAAKDAELARRDMQLEASAKVALDLSAQLAEANKALEPFAMVAEHDISEDEADSDAFRPMPKPFNHAPQITVGHLRAARRALEGGQEDG